MLLVGHVVPLQFEAVIRQAVEFNCAPDPMLKPDGTQEERTLSALLDSPQAESAFGSAGVLELQDLLTDQLGSNLRNEVAHGLETDGGFFSTEFVYAWWLLLRCVALSAHIVRTRQHDAALPPAGPADQTGNSYSTLITALRRSPWAVENMLQITVGSTAKWEKNGS